MFAAGGAGYGCGEVKDRPGKRAIGNIICAANTDVGYFAVVKDL